MNNLVSPVRLQVSYSLPETWHLVKLGDICQINPRRPEIHRADDKLTTFVPMTAIDDRAGTIARPELRTFSEVRRGYTFFQEDDVLFAKITPCMENGKHAIAENLIDGIGFGTTELHVIRPGKEVTSKWIQLFIRQPTVLASAAERFTGSVGQQRVPPDFLENLLIPIPPLPEQRRITAILADQMADVERARAAAEAELQSMNKLMVACFQGVFQKLEANFPYIPIGDFAQTSSGSTPPRNISQYYEGTIPWVKTGELQDNLLTMTEEHVSEVALQEISLRLFPEKTLLVAMYGQGQTRGRTALLGMPATVNQACFAILPNLNKYDPSYLQYWFRYSYQRLRQETEARGGNQPNLNGDILRKQLVPLPPIRTQHSISFQLNGLLVEINEMKAALEIKLKSIVQLPPALLHKAFSGKL